MIGKNIVTVMSVKWVKKFNSFKTVFELLIGFHLLFGSQFVLVMNFSPNVGISNIIDFKNFNRHCPWNEFIKFSFKPMSNF